MVVGILQKLDKVAAQLFCSSVRGGQLSVSAQGRQARNEVPRQFADGPTLSGGVAQQGCHYTDRTPEHGVVQA
ncbi:hypothetical protein D3C85_1544830 [compost metagenome]